MSQLFSQLTAALHHAMIGGVLTLTRFRNEAAAIQSQDRFNQLDNTLRVFITNVAAGQTSLTDLITVETKNITQTIVQAQEHTKTYITALLQNKQVETEFDFQRRQFLGSVKFEEMNARGNDVAEPYCETFEWIFDESVKRPWHSFVKWLRCDASLYWINGKAGCGKSCLMGFLYSHERTIEALSVWSPQEEPPVLSFFFWNSGVGIQRSFKGLLCSLLSQILPADKSYTLEHHSE
jgi:hypothetical protein